MEGWIKLHRDVLNHWVFKDNEAWKIWCYCLLNAAHVSTQIKVKSKVVDLLPGQLIFGRKQWSSILKIDEYKVYRTIMLFVEAEMIEVWTNKNYSLITVCKWKAYQFEKFAHQNAQKTTQQNAQADNAEIEGLTVDNAQENAQRLHNVCTHNKNVKNVKNKNNIYSADQLLILNHWNSKNIVQHQQTENLQKSMQKVLKDFTVEQITQAIDNYHTVLSETSYFYKHIWKLDKFLKQSNGVPEFLPGGAQWINYSNKDKKAAAVKGKPPNVGNFEQRKYDDSYYNSLYE